MTEGTTPNISAVTVHLLKGVLYREQYPNLWLALLKGEREVSDYLKVIGLELWLDEGEGYAFLRQMKFADPEEEIPRLIATRPLSYPVSLLCILLRKKLVEADAGGIEAQPIITRAQIIEMMRVFLPPQSNEAKIWDQIDAHITRVEDYGFLRKLKGQEETYEIRRILKAFVDADCLAGIENKLKEYLDARNV